jgi:hypothetical protein
VNLLELTVTVRVYDEDDHAEVDVESAFCTNQQRAWELDADGKVECYVSGLLARLACRIDKEMPLAAFLHGCQGKVWVTATKGFGADLTSRSLRPGAKLAPDERGDVYRETCRVAAYGEHDLLPHGVSVVVPKGERHQWSRRVKGWVDELLALEAGDGA